MVMFGFTDLFHREILGINKRNIKYLFEVNERGKYPLVDNKLLTRNLLMANNLLSVIPHLYTVFKFHAELRHLKERLFTLPSFAIKPARGACGHGIVILEKKEEDLWMDVSGKLWSLSDIREHISSIISGIFSLAALPDAAIIEEKIEAPDIFQSIISAGLPDVRIIVYKGVPTMAMLRLPTSTSKGCASLHKGAVGVGIDMTTGLTLSGVYQHRVVTTHPDTGRAFTGIHIPVWDKVVSLAVKACDKTGLGYVGADIVIDKNERPLVMELNARPGLSIQIANSAGLALRLRTIDEEDKGKIS